MGDFSRSPTSDSYGILGLSKGASVKEIGKAYKSLVKKWHPDKHPSNKIEAEAKFHAINQAYKELNQKKIDEKHPKNDNISSSSSSTSNNEFQLHRSLDDNSILKKPSFLTRNLSRRSKTPNPSHERNNVNRSKTITPEQDSPTSTFLHNNNRKATSGPLPGLDRNASKKSGFDQTTSWNISSPTTIWSSIDHYTSMSSSTTSSPGVLPKSISRKGSNPIIYSQSTIRRKPPPIERNLECTLEELCHGSADIIFLIEEKKHPLFDRDGDDLEIVVEVPLNQALTGCLLQIPLLGETDKMTVYIDDIIHPGYEKVIKGQGMSKSKQQGARGDLRIKFLVEFPLELADEQRAEAVRILEECCWD